MTKTFMDYERALARVRRNYSYMHPAEQGGDYQYSEGTSEAAQEALVQTWAECTDQVFWAAHAEIRGV